jgi:hypothetical protein
MEHGARSEQLAVGSWQLAVGSWQLNIDDPGKSCQLLIKKTGGARF